VFAIPFFQGAIPRVGKRLLPATTARVINNVDLDSRACVPYVQPLQYVDPTKVGVLEKIYRHNPQLGKDFSGPITGYTQANPVVVTSPNHGLETGDVITISFINRIANGRPIVTNIDTDDIVLDGQGSVEINGSKFGATQGDGKVEIGRWGTYRDPDKELQTVSAWTDTKITLTSVDFSTWGDLLDFTLYVWVTPGI
jgi:hypothetical protein